MVSVVVEFDIGSGVEVRGKQAFEDASTTSIAVSRSVWRPTISRILMNDWYESIR